MTPSLFRRTVVCRRWDVAVAWTAVAILGASTFSTIGLLATAIFRLRDEMHACFVGLRGEMAGLRTEVHALAERLSAAGA